MNTPHSGTPHVGQIRGQQVLTTMSYLCIWMKRWKLDLINEFFLATFSLRTRRAAQPREGRGAARVDLLLCCLCLRDSRGPGKAGWVAVLGSSSPQLGDMTRESLGIEGQACHAGSLRPGHSPRCRRTETSSPLCTWAHS